MATGEEVFSDSTCIGSEDLSDVVCDPCQEDGDLHTAVGMCMDCQDHLCQKCFDAHKIARPLRKHVLLDKDAMLQSQRGQAPRTKDECTEKCSVHEDKVVEYYCANDNYFGCTVCITLDHRTCDDVTYIPHVAKDLANNEEYNQVAGHLESAVKRFKKVTDGIKKKTEYFHKECSEATKMVQDFRIQINNALDKIEADLVRQCESLKSEETRKLALIAEQFQTALAELNEVMTMKEIYQNNKQNCNLYTLMMKTKYKLKLAEESIKEAEKGHSEMNIHINFVANEDTLNTLKLPETLGKILKSEQESTDRREKNKPIVKKTEQTVSVKKAATKRIVRAEHIQDIDVRHRKDKGAGDIIGLVVLPDNRLVLTDYYNNGNVKLVEIKHSRVITYLKLSSKPFDVAMVTDCQVAITIPSDKKVAMVNVKATALTVDRILDMDGACRGVDYRDGKLAVSFCNPQKVQVLTLEGSVIYTITNGQHGQVLFNDPEKIIFGQDNRSLYVSNYSESNVLHVKFDGTVVGKYTDSELKYPNGLLTDSSGHVYVCGYGSINIHQISPDSKKVKVLLSKADGLYCPQCISYSEKECRLYVGMYDRDMVKVYRVILDSK